MPEGAHASLCTALSPSNAERLKLIPSTHVTPAFAGNYGHQWVYDYAELERLAEDVGIPATAACRSDRARMGLPMPLQRAIRRAVAPKNTTVACWLDQEVREDESLYVHLTKMAEWPQPKLPPKSPKCQQPEGWLPCPADALAHTAGLLPS